jgi:hypothetical protein
MTARRAAAPLASLALLLAGCGLAANASPTVVSPRHVPFGLLQPSSPTTAPTRLGQYVTVYLKGPQRLVAVSREVPAPVTAARVLVALGAGPTSKEASDGLESPISTAVPLTIWRLGPTTVTVNVADAFTKLAGPEQAVAAAQIVYTLTVLPGIESVSIRIGGRRAKVPTTKGTLSGGPLDRADYPTVAPI